MYNDDPVTQDARFCGTTASMCGVECAGFKGKRLDDPKDEEMKEAVRLDIMLHAYMLTQSGIPMLYSGDEIGQTNDYSYKQDPEKAGDSRYIQRGKFHWELAEKKDDTSTVEGAVFQALDRLENIRFQEHVFDKNAEVYTYDVHEDAILGILREYHGERFIGLFNFSDEPKTAWMQEEGTYRSLMTNEMLELKDIEIPGHDFLWCRKIS